MYDRGSEIILMDVPDNPGDGYTVATETSTLCQKAYEMGRQHQKEHMENLLRELIDKC